jgi:homoserine O-succinyltransferase/O-acetyltransferase
MPVLLDTGRSGSTVELRGDNCLTIGLVNNMPDAAVDATERQFLDLIRAATPNVIVRCKLFSIPEVPRSDHVRGGFAERYRDISELWDTHLDGLIVTGTEPRAASLKDEPYWPALTRLVAWARENTDSTIWSCLAAHAAVLHADGIERQPRKEKLFGVFDCQTAAMHRLIAAIGPQFAVPHSRYNDLPELSLAAAGYRILSRSAATGVDMFVRQERASSLFVFFQGHPEYAADTLAREYRRDVGRFLRGEREHFPALPKDYFGKQATALLDTFRDRGIGDRREKLIRDFPMREIEAELPSTWRSAAIAIYENWVAYLQDRKAERRVPVWAARRVRRGAWRSGNIRPAADGSTAG